MTMRRSNNGSCLFLSHLIFGVLALSGIPSIAAGHDKPDLHKTLDYITVNIERGALFESNGCVVKMADMRSMGGVSRITFSLSHVDLSRGDADTPGIATEPSRVAIYIARRHVVREDHSAWEFDDVYLNTSSKRLARALSHAAKLCDANAIRDQ